MKQLFLLLITAGCTCLATAQWKGFSSFTGYAVKKTPIQLLIQDINADGLKDILTMYMATDTELGMLQAKAKGAFLPEQHFSKPFNYSASDLADFNKDGYSDLVISSYWENGFMMYPGNGSGNFTNGTFMATGTHGKEIKCFDINKDGNMDIVATSSGSGNPVWLHIFIGRGDGTFLPKKSYRSPLETSNKIFITDKNNDGRTDIVVTSAFPWVQTWYQLPDGNFEDKYHFTNKTARVALADFNKDDKDDIFLYYFTYENDPGHDSLLIKLNTGDTTYGPSIRVSFPSGKRFKPGELKITDLNKDGFPDLFMNNTDLGGDNIDTLYYALGAPNYRFNDPVAIALPAAVKKFKLADIDADGYDDLVVACTNQHIYVALTNAALNEDPDNNIIVYPNPAQRTVHVRDAQARAKIITLYNTAGQPLQQTISKEQLTKLTTATLPAGLYFLHIQMPREAVTCSFLKQ
jgi:hypothetical protein